MLPSSSSSSETGCDVNTQSLFLFLLSECAELLLPTHSRGKAEEEAVKEEKDGADPEKPASLFHHDPLSRPDNQPTDPRTGLRRKTDRTGERLAAVVDPEGTCGQVNSARPVPEGLCVCVRVRVCVRVCVKSESSGLLETLTA